MSSIDRSQSAHWEAYWNAAVGRREAVSGDAPGDLFDENWGRFLTGAFSAGSHLRALDIACGAGVIIDRAADVAARMSAPVQIVGLDYAVSAAASVMQRPPRVGAVINGVAASAAALPFADASFDVVVSQFGIEYAGSEAFDEAARILAPDGVIQFILHHKGGGIDRECSENARVLGAVLNSNLFGTAIAAIRSAGSGGAIAELKRIFDSLKPCLDGEPVAAKGMLGRLMRDVAQLVSRHQAYHPSEAVGWCEAMRTELILYEGRMRAMTQCALDEAGVNEVRARLGGRGAAISPPETLTPKGKTMPAAWLLKTEGAK